MFTTTTPRKVMIKRYLPVLACCLSLVACGSGGGTATPASGSIIAAPASASASVPATPASVPATPATPATNSAPTASAVTVTDSNGGRVVVGDTLVGSYTYADAEGDIEGASSFRWLRNGTAIASAIASTYTLTAADSGKIMIFEVTPVAATGTLIGAAATSTAIIVVNKITTASIVPSRTACTAPCGIMFDATGSTSLASTQPFFELDYKWDYGDVGATFQQRPGINANKSSSPIGAHVYDKAGTYIATLTVSDSAGSIPAVQQVTIIVKDPNVTYAGQTYCVSNTNNFIACPTQDPAFHLTSYNIASFTIAGFKSTPTVPKRVLFHSGETFNVVGNTRIRNLQASLLISSYGAGAKPILRDNIFISQGFFTVDTSNSVIFTGLNFSGNYSPITGLGTPSSGLFFGSSDTNILIYRNNFSGLTKHIDIRDNISTNSTIKPKFNMVVDNNLTDWRNMGIFGMFGYLSSVLGNTMKQNPLAKSGSEGKCRNNCPGGVNFPDHGPIRIASSDHLLIQYNDMFNNAGWSSAGLAHQSNIRLGTNGPATKSVVADNMLEGGFSVLSMQPANSTFIETNDEVIIERNTLTATSNTEWLLDTSFGGADIRYNTFIKPNNGSPPIGARAFSGAIQYTAIKSGTYPPTPNLIHINNISHNTFTSFATVSAPNVKFIQVGGQFSLFKIFHNTVKTTFAQGTADAGFLSWISTGALTGVQSDYNTLTAPITNFVWNNGTSEPISVWQASGNGIHSIHN